MRIMLINSGNDPEIGGNANRQSFPPLNIISLGTALKAQFGDLIDLRLLDGQVDTVDGIVDALKVFRPELVGISMYCTSICNTMRITREAKALGARTVLGNDHAAMHYATILRGVPEVDFICCADVGEQSLVSLVAALQKGEEMDSVPALAYRREEAVVLTPQSRAARGGNAAALDSILVPDRSLLAARYWEYYLSVFRNQHHRVFDASKASGVATINRARGCARARRRCRYCGILDLTPRGASPALFWEDVRMAKKQVNASFLYEAFDSATSWPRLIESWATSKPGDLADTRFMLYAQAAETDRAIVEIFQRLGVYCVNTGFDSGDTRSLKLLKGPQDSLQANKKAAELWTAAGIEMHVSFVLFGLGGESETRRGLDATVEFAEWLVNKTTTVSLDCAVLYPDKAAPVGSWIWEPSLALTEAPLLGWDFIRFDLLAELSRKWRDEVVIDALEISSDFAKICGVDYELLLEYDKIIQRIAWQGGLNYGRSQSGPLDG